MNNAYDLRYSNYRYIRGKSELIDKCESIFPNSLLVPSGMAALSLILQFYRPKSIWYPKDLFRENQSLIKLLGIPFDNVNPEMVLVECPSFCNNKYENPYPNALFVVDNSVDPEENPECDILITSLSKHYMNCESVLGLITLKTHQEDLKSLELLRCRSGYVVFDFQCESFLRNYQNFHKLMSTTRCNAIEVSKLLDNEGIRNIRAGSMVFVLVDGDAKSIAFKTPFELRPTYGCDRTFCSYSYYEEDMIYWGSPYIRLSIGVDYTPIEIVECVIKALKSV